MAEKMDRGSGVVTDAYKAHLESAEVLDVRQTRRGGLKEILGREAPTEFNYYDKDGTKFAQSSKDTSSVYPFTMRVNEVGTDAELFTVERPTACSLHACKCCCYQNATFTSGGAKLGSIVETSYFCVPSFKINDQSGQQIYLLHPPTCCGGVCVNRSTEGKKPCGKGCGQVPFWIFDPSTTNTNGGEAPRLGKILRKPNSIAFDISTDENAYEVVFPTQATVEQKAMLVGTVIFLNANFFEGNIG